MDGTRIEDRLPQAFLARMRAQLGNGYPAYLAAMEQSPRRALRVNSLKIEEESFADLVDFTISCIPILHETEKSFIAADDFSNSVADPFDIIAISSPNSEDIAIISCSSPRFPILSSAHTVDITNIHSTESHNIEKSSGTFDIPNNIPNCSSHTLAKSFPYADDFTNTEPHCYLFPDDVAIGRHPLHMAGLVYVQEPSAQLPAQLLSVRPGMTVLDLCAAPGGKTGQLAAAMENTGLLISNEPVPARAEVLTHNVERLGIRNCVVTCMYPDALCEKLAGLCDAVLVDAPCSGEGMFRRDAEAIADWSPAHVTACAVRQRAILEAADLALRPGGALVYSTCTFSPEENEETVQEFLETHRDYRLLSTRRAYPHTSAGEGQFMAKLIKGDAIQTGSDRRTASVPSGKRPPAPSPAKPCPEWKAFEADTFLAPFAAETVTLPDGRVLLPPTGFDRLPQGLRILRAGVLLGEIRSHRFLPAHTLAMAAKSDDFRRLVPLSDTQLAAYLAGETVPCDPAFTGFCAVTYKGCTLGLGKAVHGTLKNHLPKGLRIRG